jgi:TPR repeat protein
MIFGRYIKVKDKGKWLIALTLLSAGIIIGNLARISPNTAKSALIKDLSEKAEKGDDVALWNLGYMYEHGESVAQDYKEAVKWYRKGAEQGDDRAEYNLGQMYYKGQGVAQNYKQAVKWYTKAAEQGHVYAQFGLGVMYEKGLGALQNYSKAAEWYIKAAEQGLVEARVNLAAMDTHGDKQDIVFSGTPTVRINEGGGPRAIEDVKPAEASGARCTIIRIDDKYFWQTRNNVELTMVTSGAFITFVANSGAGYIRIIQPELKDAAALMGETEQKFDYVEHMVIGLRSVTYYGKAK